MLTERRSSGQTPAELSEAGIGRAAVKGAIIGYFAVLAIVGGIVLAAGAGLGVALAVGAYVAIWGGPGWGGMIGAQRYADRIADDERSADLMSLPDGRVLIVGGTDWYNEPALLDRNEGDPVDAGLIELEGLRNARLFDPATDSFSPAGHMAYGRWYPTLVELPDGKVLVASGVTKLIKDTQGSQVRRTETFNPATNTWTENYVGPASENSLPLVSRLVLAPNGKIFYTGVGQMWGPFGQSVDEALFALQQFFDPATKTWEVTGVAPFGARDGASVVPCSWPPRTTPCACWPSAAPSDHLPAPTSPCPSPPSPPSTPTATWPTR